MRARSYVALAATTVLAACGAFREFWMDSFNWNMRGHDAPAIQGTAWVLPLGETDPPELEGGWRILSFFDPG